jgi:Flp pilus assembly protein TadG
MISLSQKARSRAMSETFSKLHTFFWPRRRLGRKGSSAVEFAMIMGPFLALFVGVVEISWQLTVASALERATLRASRFGVTGQATRAGVPATSTCRSQTINWIVAESSGRILDAERLTVRTEAFGSASGMGGASAAGAGGGGQVALYTVTYIQPFLTGVWLRLVGGPEHLTHTTTIVVKNEPFDNATC